MLAQQRLTQLTTAEADQRAAAHLRFARASSVAQKKREHAEKALALVSPFSIIAQQARTLLAQSENKNRE